MQAIDPVADIFVHAEKQLAQPNRAGIASQDLAPVDNETTESSVSEISQTDPKKLASIKKVATDFEAVFLTEMMRSLVPQEQEENAFFGGGESDKIFRQMMVDEYAKQIAKSGGIGIASQIERQLLGQAPQTAAPRNNPFGNVVKAYQAPERNIEALLNQGGTP